MRKTIICCLCLAASLALYAQRPADFHQRELEELFQAFSLTNNAAGMGLAQPSAGSKTQIRLYDEAGDYHLTQKGNEEMGFRFSTLRYDTFNDKLFMRGSFYYNLGKEKNRPWSDVMDPWFSIPYIYGSAVSKDYDSHDCGLTFDLYTAPLANWISVGVRTKYRVADISGLLDPRPRTGYLNWQAVPSALVTLGAHHIGLDFGYGYSKEKLSNLTTVQTDPRIAYYKMTGLEHMDGAVLAYKGFKRQFEGGRFIGDLSYSYAAGPVSVLVSGGMEYGALSAIGDKMQITGTYNYLEYNGLVDATYRGGRLVHNLRVNGRYKDAGADEYIQELVAEKNPDTGVTTQTWETIYVYRNRYMLKTWNIDASYRIYGGYSGKDYIWSAGLGGALEGFRKDYYLPSSHFLSSALNLSVNGSVRLFQVKGHKLELALDGSFRKSLGSDLTLTLDNEYVREVLTPDKAYYDKDALRASGSVTWTFPLSLGKAGKASGYLRVEGGHLAAFPEGRLSRAEVTIGLFTF